MKPPELWSNWLIRRITGVPLRVKLVGMVFGLVLLIGLAVTATVRARLDADLRQSLDERGIALTRSLAARAPDFLLTGNTFALHQLVRETLENNPDVRYVFLLDATGKPLVHSFPQTVPPGLLTLNPPALADSYRLQPFASEEGDLTDVAVPILQGRIGMARIGLSHVRLEEAVARATWQLVGITGAAMLLGAGIALLLTRVLTRPVLELVSVTRRVGEGDLEARARPLMADEIGELARAFNNMAANLQSSRADLLRRLRELATLNATATAISSSLGAQDMLGAALAKVLEVMGLQAGWVFLEPGLRLTAQAGLSLAFAREEATRELGQCVCGQVLRTGQPLVVRDICHECPRLSREVILAEGLACHASVPLVSRDRVVGVLNVASRQSREFSRDDLTLLDSIGRQIGVAVENARLWEEVKEKETLRGQLLEKIIAAQEAERQRLARELHDEAGQVLTALSLGLRTLEDASGLNPHLRAQASEMKQLSTRLMEELHRLAVELRPSALDRVGLVAAVEQYVADFSRRFGIAAQFEADGLGRVKLRPEVEISLYRVVQEALTNVARHSGATHVAIMLQHRAESVVAIVEDDGAGFDPAQAGRERLGLFGMQERAALLGGRLTIESEEGKGTTVFAKVPL